MNLGRKRDDSDDSDGIIAFELIADVLRVMQLNWRMHVISRMLNANEPEALGT